MTTEAPQGGTSGAHTTYKEHCANTDWEGRQVQGSRVLNVFATGGDNPKTGEQLYDDIRRTSEEMPHVYLMLVRDARRIAVLHRTMHFTAPMGTDEETWMERLLTFAGDVIEDQLPQAAIVPVRLFTALSQPAKTVKLQKMLLGFQQDDNRETFTADMPGHTEEDCESVHTRPAVCVPPELASFHLSDKVTPRQALVQTHAWCTRNEKLEEHKILLEWLQVACMVDGRAAIQRSQSPMVPLMDADLTARLLAKVRHDLPGWRRAPVLPPPPQIPSKHFLLASHAFWESGESRNKAFQTNNPNSKQALYAQMYRAFTCSK